VSGARRLLALAAVAVSLVGADTAAANPAAQLHPLYLRVVGCEAPWCADSVFRLDWDRPPIATAGFPIAAVHFRVRDASGAMVVPETRLPWDTTFIERINVPAVPGTYTADVWLEGPDNALGPEISTALRFDDARPGSVRPLAPPGWIARDAAAVVSIQHPDDPLPASGIRGYAFSVDRGGGSLPCAASNRCTVAETDLRDGIGDDTIALGGLPEGVNVVRVLAVSGSGVSSATAGSAIVRVDATRPKVDLAGVPRGWANGPVRLLAKAADALSGMAANGPAGPHTAIAIDGAVPKMEAGDSTTATVAGEGTHRIAAFARDAAGNATDGWPTVATVSIDEGPPAVTFARAQDPTEPERLEATVADSLSAPSPARGSISVRLAGSRQRWLPLPTAVAPGRLVAGWDSDSFPAGTYEFRATGYDAAGNTTSSERRGGGARMVLANPVKTPTRIEAGFGGPRLVWHRCARDEDGRRCRREAIRSFAARPTAREVPYGRGLSFGGRLTSASGSPLGGLPVQVTERFAAGAASPQRSTTVLTAADGAFLTHLAPGPSRRVEATFAGNRVLSGASGGQVRLGVLAGVRLRASSASARIGGPPVTFSGRAADLGAPIPPGGIPVELQFKAPGGDWREFRTVQTDAGGRFRYAYAFSDDDSRGVRFLFRAFVPSQSGWPYEPAASRPVDVIGR
jgi:hypothetical protein